MWILSSKRYKYIKIGELMDKNNKKILITGILFVVFSILSLPLFIESIIQYKESKTLSYSDLRYIEGTVETVRKSGNSEDGYTILISLKEDKKRIKINNLLTKHDVVIELMQLENGDRIYCYVKEKLNSYEIIEIKSEIMILSLEDYKQVMYKNGLLGLIIFPIVFSILVGIGLYSIVVSLKDKSKIDINKWVTIF